MGGRPKEWIYVHIKIIHFDVQGFLGGSVVKNLPTMHKMRHGFHPWVRKIPWRRA